MGLESGDVGIEDTLYSYFSEEYDYINQLAKYLKHWARTVRIRDIRPKTTHIKASNNDFYISFNYTAVLETTYKISSSNILHIHGSLSLGSYEESMLLALFLAGSFLNAFYCLDNGKEFEIEEACCKEQLNNMINKLQENRDAST